MSVFVYAALLDGLDARRQRPLADALMSPIEEQRCARFVFERSRREYAYAHALTRIALSRHVPSVAPASWTFAEEPGGRPFVTGPVPAGRVRFNLSHTDGLVAVAVVLADVDVGVDVEAVEPARATMDVAERFFARAEFEALAALPPSEQTWRFFQYWTLKEAYLKARGVGLAARLSDFCVYPEGEPPTITFVPGAGDDGARWQLFQRPIGDHHLLAACVARADPPRTLELVLVDDLTCA